MVFFFFIQNLIENSVLANSGDPDQALHFAASDLGLHRLSTCMSHKKDARLI